jgi:TRAP-type C4-dicarboxylate transport system substrate-binding protein
MVDRAAKGNRRINERKRKVVMKKKIFFGIIVFLLVIQGVSAQRKITIKMASPLPDNTPWGQFFNELAEDWKRITNGEVELIVYHNGVAGNEKDMLRSLKINQIQAAVLSTLGLSDISPEIFTLSCPFLIRDDAELDKVLAGVLRDLQEKIDSKGYFTLTWARVGWIKFFSKSPIFTPTDLKRQRLGTLSDQAELNQVFRAIGLQMVPIDRDNILLALNSGIVDAVFQSPIAVGGTQAFGLAKNMASINVAPFLGGIVFNQRAWRSIPDKYKSQLLESVRRKEALLDVAVRQLEDNMIKTMGNYGLVVNQLSPQQEQLWYDEMARVMPNLVGTAFDRGIFRRIEAILNEHRNGRR